MKLSTNIRNKILLIIFSTISILFSYLIITNYYTSYNRSQDDSLTYLYGVARTASVELSGDEHDYIVRNYKEKDAIKTNTESGIYLKLHKTLKRIHDVNEMNSSIYTMIFDSTNKCAYFIISSSDEPFYRHQYLSYSKEFVDNYRVGGKIKSYEDENGKWLSAFAPIKDKNGNTVGVVQADLEFSGFLKDLRIMLIKEISVSLIILFITLFLMYRFLNGILLTQERLTEALKIKNNEINQSIEYSKYIFDAAIVKPQDIEKYVPESFVFFKPKDIISGDFYVFYPFENENGTCTKYVFGVFDCTGHGVSGAILSMLGLSIINNAMPLIQNHPPSRILDILNEKFISQMNQNNENENNHAGMEGALCVVDTINCIVEFAGAKRNLHIYDKAINNFHFLKGSKKAIGQSHHENLNKYVDQKIQLKKGDNLYLFSDGISDQFTMATGGNKKVKLKVFLSYLASIQNSNMNNQQELLSLQFRAWKGNLEQTDDVTVLGVTI